MAGIRGRAIRATLILAPIAFGLGLSPRALAQSASDGAVTDYPLPSAAGEAYSPIGEGFESPVEPREDLKGPKPYIDQREVQLEANPRRQTLAPFFRDTDLRVNSRTYWFDEDAFGNATPRALTTGGYLTYQSGFAADFSSSAPSSIPPSPSMRRKMPAARSISRKTGIKSPRSARSMRG